MRPIRVAAVALVVVALQSIEPARGAQSSDGAVPILMYHVLADAPPDARYPELYVSPQDFLAQLDWLHRRGYTAVTLWDVWKHWHGHRRLPTKPVVITFDDGFRNTHAVGLPALRSHGWRGVLNLTLSHLGPGWGLTHGRMRALIRSGWEIGAHTLTHPDLTRSTDAELAREVSGSKRALERRLGVPVRFFCYPAGRFNGRVIAAVRRAGFLGATTTIDGLGRRSEPYALRRIRVSGADGVGGLAAKLTQSR